MKVTDPTGLEWTIKRQWVPRYKGRGVRARLGDRRAKAARRRDDGRDRWFDWIDIPFVDDSLTATLVLLVVFGLLIALALFGFPVLLAIVDLVIIGVATLVGVIARVLFRRPWTIEARSARGHEAEVKVVGWRNASAEIDAFAERIRAGVSPSTS